MSITPIPLDYCPTAQPMLAGDQLYRAMFRGSVPEYIATALEQLTIHGEPTPTTCAMCEGRDLALEHILYGSILLCPEHSAWVRSVQ